MNLKTIIPALFAALLVTACNGTHQDFLAGIVTEGDARTCYVDGVRQNVADCPAIDVDEGIAQYEEDRSEGDDDDE